MESLVLHSLSRTGSGRSERGLINGIGRSLTLFKFHRRNVGSGCPECFARHERPGSERGRKRIPEIETGACVHANGGSVSIGLVQETRAQTTLRPKPKQIQGKAFVSEVVVGTELLKPTCLLSLKWPRIASKDARSTLHAERALTARQEFADWVAALMATVLAWLSP